MRTLTIAVALATSACGSSTSPKPANLNAVRASLRSADSAAALTGLLPVLADSAIYEQNGLPIIVGQANIRPPSLTWKSLFVDVSAAGDVGYTYGQASMVDSGPQPLLYIAFWRRVRNAWRIEAWMMSPGSATPTPPSGPYATPTTATSPSYAPGKESVLATDQAFSDLSVYVGQDSSFTVYADTLGIQTGTDFVYGKAAIRSYFFGTPISQVLSWTPTFSDVASSNDLAYTAGPYVFISTTASYGQYLSIWKREADGSWRYVQDGGTFTGTQPVSP